MFNRLTSTLNRRNVMVSMSSWKMMKVSPYSQHHRNHEQDYSSNYKYNFQFNASTALKAASALVLYLFYDTFKQKAENCGIVGIVGSDDASDFLLDGLTILKNRGYDSAGMATISDEGDLIVSKFASKQTTADCIDLLRNNSTKHLNHHIGIAHTRWATHGGKTDSNAHPHVDFRNQIAIIHNGTINNAFELRQELVKQGIPFKSETDTEVIAQLIGIYVHEGLSTKNAVTKALERCDGSWGLAVINKNNPKEIVVACNGSPMVIGLGQGKTYIASETTAFSRYTKNFIAMKDKEIAVITDDHTPIDISRVRIAPDSEALLTPYPYPHFTIKECLEQPESIARALNYGARLDNGKVVLGGLDSNKQKLEVIRNLVLTGCGTSLFAAKYGVKLMRDIGAFDTVTDLDSAEVRKSDIPKHSGGLIVVSQSGETKDVHRALRIGMEEGIPCLSVVNCVGSLIARTSGMGAYLNAGREHAVASTKAFTSQVTVLALIGLWFKQQQEKKSGTQESMVERELLDALQRLPICFGMGLRTRSKCAKIAQELLNKRDIFVLGKGYGEPIAYEGALKIKELTYIHAEGFSGGALKHGPFALIDDASGPWGQTPVICIILDDEHANHMRIAAEEVKARGARVIVITDNAKLAAGIDQSPIVIPSNGPLTALCAVLPLQLIAYELAVAKGINPDVPRNLAKAVTTD